MLDLQPLKAGDLMSEATAIRDESAKRVLRLSVAGNNRPARKRNTLLRSSPDSRVIA